MKSRLKRIGVLLAIGLGFLWSCPWDTTLRAFMNEEFWLPFAKRVANFEKPNVTRTSAAFAGMTADKSNRPLGVLRAAYQKISQPQPQAFDEKDLKAALSAARGDRSLTPREKEEVDLIDAKIDMRAGQPSSPERLQAALQKLEAFLRTAKTPEFLSEARGWTAYIHYLQQQQTIAGKMYLDELNLNGSNLSRDSMLNSLRMTYHYDGGAELAAHIDEYFDTPEHAAFAIQIATNPHYPSPWTESDGQPAQAYERIKGLLNKHRDLLRSTTGSNHLAVLSMRAALRMGDPAWARKIAAEIPAKDAVRAEPDFNWMLGSTDFLLKDYAGAEKPLLALFRSTQSSENQKAAAAYGLFGVYRELKNPVEQIRYALWLDVNRVKVSDDLSHPSEIWDLSLYWAESGWDSGLLLDVEAPIDALRHFVAQNPNLQGADQVRYALAVRLARENQYQESAELYEAVKAADRADRMRRLAELYKAATAMDVTEQKRLEAKYKLAEYISSNPDRLYFNDTLWGGMQRYAFIADSDTRMPAEEKAREVELERKLKDDQEERWRAYLILSEIVDADGKTALGRKAAQLALNDLVRISERFGRAEEIRKAKDQLAKWLRG